MKKVILSLFFTACLAGAAYAANLTGHTASVADAAGSARNTFSNSETIALRQQVSNAVQGTGMVNFTFVIKNPGGATIFTLPNNEAPSTPGLSQAQIVVPISRFYSIPGDYTFEGSATLDLEPSKATPVTFTISSPNLTLIYPPSGARGLSDTPLVFRWIGSGASQYLLRVSKDAGFPAGNTHEARNIVGTSYAYPQNPPNDWEKLVSGPVYNWKVEGLDAVGNTISGSNIYNFSMGNQANSQSRNLIVTDLSLSSPFVDRSKALNFLVSVYNAGNNAETNIGLKMSLGGISADRSPWQIQMLTGGERAQIPFTAFMPADQESSLAVACLDIFDDNLTDNCKTKLIAQETGSPVVGGPSKKMSYDELWEELKKRLGPDALKALEGYTFESIECGGCSGSELDALLAALVSGDATLAGASITETGGAAPASIAQTSQAGPETAEDAGGEAPSEVDLEVINPAASGDEWTGYSSAFSEKEISTFVVTEKKAWKKLWQSLSESELPEVDFSQKMVLGIVSASGDRAETVRILSKRKTADAVAVDYYYIQAPKGKDIPGAAYILKVTGKETEKVNFRRLDIGRSTK